MRTHLALLSPLALTLLTGCPQRVTPEEGPPPTPKVVKVSDTDSEHVVVRDTDDLYAADPKNPRGPTPVNEVPAGGLGSGKPDETNGVCRLYAPKLAEPMCCPTALGFDVESVQQACGQRIYLGESYHASCGYYFHDPKTGGQSWFRLTYALEPTPREAADAHDERMQIRMDLPDFKSTPVPGVAGAFWSTHEGVHWAFLPGWPRVRLFSWRDEQCGDAEVAKIIARLVAAPPVAADAPRTLIPSDGVPG
ncbi:MAG: hypothetical protein KC636_13950 [Myxococcales bacterium]|nr:hypothetical protein [Myxococcales bacterium]